MTFPADSARFTEILEATLRDLVRTGERLSNDNETKAFDLLEERFRATGVEVKRETVPLFVSTVPHAHLEVNGETLRAQGNAMTAPVTTGAGGSRRFRVTGKPVPWTDDIKAPEEPAVAVVTGLANLGILRRAERLGFAGVLFVTGERIHRMIVSDVWGSPVPGVEDRYVSIPNASIDNATAERLGDGPVTLEIETESRWIASPVLTATLPGTESDRYALLTGHIDSWGAGAIDNASGLAASTAILDTLAETPHPYGLKVVVWSGHSHGRYAGSTAWCDRHASELARSAFLHVNLDCLGMAGSTLYGFAPAMPSTEALRAARSPSPKARPFASRASTVPATSPSLRSGFRASSRTFRSCRPIRSSPWRALRAATGTVGTRTTTPKKASTGRFSCATPSRVFAR